MTKKKILYIVTKSNFGGAQKNVFDLATNLPKDQFEAVVASGGNGTLFEKLEDANIKTRKIENLGRDISATKDTSSFFTLLKIIKEENPDVVHLHSPKAGGLGAFAVFLLNLSYKLKAKSHKLRVIYTSHGWPFNENRSLWQKFFIKILSWLTIIFSTKTIVLGEFEKNQVNNWPFVSKKITVIPNGIELKEILSKEEAGKRIFEKIGINMPENSILVGTIAELHKNKGLTYAISAISEIEENIYYFILGEGEERKNLEELIAKKDLKERVFLLGQVEEASSLLKAFDIFILPSIKEGLPYTLLEAGVAETPIIATKVGNISELIEDKKEGLLVTPNNEQELKNTILFNIANKIIAEEMAKKLKEKIENKYNLQKMVINTCKIY